MPKRHLIVSLLAGSALLPALSPEASAQVLFSDTFDSDTSALWNVNASAGQHAATFNFDYSTIGIPAAPGSGGTTRGLKLEANFAGATFGGLSVSPIAGGALPSEYVLSYNLWQNFPGPLPAGGSGSTQVSGAGVGTLGTSAQWAGGTFDSVVFGATGDGGSAQDYRVYPVGALATPASGFYAAGTGADVRNASDPYYSVFGGQTPPAAQTDLFPAQQIGATAAGTQGFQWHQHVITKTADQISWSIDGTTIVTVPTSGLAAPMGGNSFLLNHFDINATISTDPAARTLLFGLFDNVTVSAVPEPSTLTLVGIGAFAFALRRRRS